MRLFVLFAVAASIPFATEMNICDLVTDAASRDARFSFLLPVGRSRASRDKREKLGIQ